MNKLLLDAIIIAQSNPYVNKFKMAALLVNDKGEKYTGFNQFKTHPLSHKFSKNGKTDFQHAELSVIIKAIRSRAKASQSHYKDVTDLSDFDMYVARVLKNGSPALSYPCSGCSRAILAFGIRSVQWTL